MSTVVIVGIVAAGLFLLVTIAVTMQTVEKNNKEKRRLHNSLTARARNLQYMLTHFPQGFLNHDLQVLVNKCLLQVYEQLTQLDPTNQQYTGRADQVKQQLAQLKTTPAANKNVKLTDTRQIQEIQKLLNTLFNFIARLTESKKISPKEGQIYAKQIRRLMVQSSTDALAQATNQALQEGKHRLAIHYLQMAIEKMNKENADGFYSSSINQHNEQISTLNQAALEQEKATKEQQKKNAEQWDELSKENDTWKKKVIYD